VFFAPYLFWKKYKKKLNFKAFFCLAVFKTDPNVISTPKTSIPLLYVIIVQLLWYFWYFDFLHQNNSKAEMYVCSKYQINFRDMFFRSSWFKHRLKQFIYKSSVRALCFEKKKSVLCLTCVFSKCLSDKIVLKLYYNYIKLCSYYNKNYKNRTWINSGFVCLNWIFFLIGRVRILLPTIYVCQLCQLEHTSPWNYIHWVMTMQDRWIKGKR